MIVLWLMGMLGGVVLPLLEILEVGRDSGHKPIGYVEEDGTIFYLGEDEEWHAVE